MYPLDSHCTCAQITKLVYEVSEEDVVRARNQLKSSILFSIDGSGGERPSIHLACEHVAASRAALLCRQVSIQS